MRTFRVPLDASFALFILLAILGLAPNLVSSGSFALISVIGAKDAASLYEVASITRELACTPDFPPTSSCQYFHNGERNLGSVLRQSDKSPSISKDNSASFADLALRFEFASGKFYTDQLVAVAAHRSLAICVLLLVLVRFLMRRLRANSKHSPHLPDEQSAVQGKVWACTAMLLFGLALFFQIRLSLFPRSDMSFSFGEAIVTLPDPTVLSDEYGRASCFVTAAVGLLVASARRLSTLLSHNNARGRSR